MIKIENILNDGTRSFGDAILFIIFLLSVESDSIGYTLFR